MNTIIKLKESDGVKNSNNTQFRNGKWVTTLKSNLVLYDGDSVSLRNIFIDTKQISESILVKSPTTLVMKFVKGACLNRDILLSDTGASPLEDNTVVVDPNIGYNVTDTNPVTNPQRAKFSVITETKNNRGDSHIYYPCKYVSNNTNYKQATSLTFSVSFGNSHNTYGDAIVQFQYTAASGIVKDVFIKLDKVPISSQVHTQNLPQNQQFIYDVTKPIQIVSPSLSDLRNIYNTSAGFDFTGVKISIDDVLELYENTKTIVIQPGVWNPSTLGEYITYKMNEVVDYGKTTQWSNITDPSKNTNDVTLPLFDYKNDDVIYGPVNYSSILYDNGYYYVSSDSNSMIKTMDYIEISQDNPIYGYQLFGGCSEFSLQFDSTTQSFKISNLHSPYYIGGTGSNPTFNVGHKVSQWEYTSSSNKNTIFYNDTSKGDILITSLTSSNEDPNDTTNFWFDSLGFDNTIITSVGNINNTYTSLITPVTTPATTPAITKLQVPLITKQYGYNSTMVQIGQEAKLLKGKFLFNINETYPDAGSEFLNSDTTQIIAANNISQLSINQGYYSIIIKGDYASNRLHSSTDIKLISAIVSKYYSNSSYTNGFSSDGITYTHSGLPITISTFDIEIQDSNGDPAADINDDNTIFLNVQRNQPME
jgi:hypothetical protein